MSVKYNYEMIKDYKNVIKNFAELSAVPRGSYHNEKISAFLCEFAKKNGLWYRQDEALNVIIKKPATKGMEAVPAVILQGHMDMVCVKDPDSAHDFENEPLELMLDGEWLHANGTTLGADDGISIAYMMSLLTDETAVHPEIICVITTDEETGMEGAYALDFSDIKHAKYLVNIDSDIEGQCLCGCAGGLRIDGRIPVVREKVSGTALEVKFTKLRGGHSGAEIHKYITNAVRLAARALKELEEFCDYRVVKLYGGEKDNAIPSFAGFKLVINGAFDKEKLTAYLKNLENYYLGREPMMVTDITFTENEEAMAATKASFEKVLFALLMAPNGVQAMSRELPELVETSLNLGIFELAENEAVFNYSLRSSVSSEKDFLSKRVRMMLEMLGGTGTEKNKYPAWEFMADSKLRDFFVSANESVLGYKPEVTVIHAGLECGLFAEKCPGLDMISFGPNMLDIHSPRERLNMASALRLYRVLEELLSKIN